MFNEGRLMGNGFGFGFWSVVEPSVLCSQCMGSSEELVKPTPGNPDSAKFRFLTVFAALY